MDRNKVHRQPCILIFEREAVSYGGQQFDRPAEIETAFVYRKPDQGDAYIGFSLRFPIKQAAGRSLPPRVRMEGGKPMHDIQLLFRGQDITYHHLVHHRRLTSHLSQFAPVGPWTAIKFTARPTPIGFPMPYYGDAPFDGYINRNEPIKGSITLRGLCSASREFLCLVPHESVSDSTLQDIRTHSFSYLPVSNK